MTDTMPPQRQLRSSIDYALDLEHQLAHEEGDAEPPSAADLDPQILADLIIQLRASTAQLTAERDELQAEVAAAHAREAAATDAAQHADERRAAAEEELATLRAKAEEDASAIAMLRRQVEDSRRGVMRLQTESRRMSAQFPPPLDLRTPKSAKRQSFTPITGTFKVPGLHSPSASVSGSGFPPPPVVGRAISDPGTEGDDMAGALQVPEPRTARRFAGGRSPPRESLLNPLGAELDALRRELVDARMELAEVKAELSESDEARQASESCVKALREFIAQGGTAGGADDSGLSLPPMPTDSHIKEIGDEEEKPKGWGFKGLWRSNSQAAPTHERTPSMARRESDASETQAQRPAVAVSLGSLWGSKSPPQPQQSSPATSLAPSTTSKKFGFFWSNAQQAPPPVPAKDGPPSLSPSQPLDWSSGEEASEPTSPHEHADEDGAQELIVHYDDALTDGESAPGSDAGAKAEDVLTPRVEQHGQAL